MLKAVNSFGKPIQYIPTWIDLGAARMTYVSDCTNFYNGKPIKRGSIVFYDAERGYLTDEPIGWPAMIMEDVVNIDLMTQHLNYHKNEVQVGSKVTAVRLGTVTIRQQDFYPNANKDIYWDTKRKKYRVTKGRHSILIGKSLSNADSDGFFKLEVNLMGR